MGDGLAHSLAGAVVIEAVFTWPGIGNLLITGVRNRDTVLTCGCIILITLIITVLLLIVDLLYAVADPRIKAQYARGGGRR